jgi:UDP-N-acetylglucosamine 1-carboxyvinyltransferase
MDSLVVEGGTPLRGTVPIGGAKNAALPILAACILAEGPVTLHNVPRLSDVDFMTLILAELGVVSRWVGEHSVQLEAVDESVVTAHYDLVRKMRGSFCVLGPLLGKRGRAVVSLPGGCVIGTRPVDLHLKGLRALGAKLRYERGYVVGDGTELRGGEIYLGGPNGSTCTGTANVLMAAVLAKGRTTIVSAACDPEVMDLCRFLVTMGAHIEGIGSPHLVVEGVTRLQGTTYTIIPDRIEAGTFLLAGAITRGEVTAAGAVPDHLTAVLDKLTEMGVDVQATVDSVTVRSREAFRPIDVTTLPPPGFPTDLQAQMTALLTLADGVSVVTERIFPDRFMHVAELNRMGADIRKEGPSAIIKGVKELSGAPVMASDLRASAALIVAGLAARDTTVVNRVYHIDRGYEHIEQKLGALGAQVKRVSEYTVPPPLADGE